LPRVLRMPDVTAGPDEGLLAAWLVEESARFDAAQTIAYVETEDELFSVEAGRPGVLLKTLVEPGTRVATGTPIGLLGEPWEQVHDLDPLLAELGVAPTEHVVERVMEPSWFEASVSGHRAQPSPELAVVAELTMLDPALDPTLDPVESAPEPRRGTHAAEVLELHHHYLRARVRVDRLVALSSELERERPGSGVTDLVDRAVLAAHRQVPQLAVAHTAGGRGAAPGIPVSHPGRFGVEEAVVVVPTGHSAALAVGGVSNEPVIDGGAVVPGKLITLTLSVRPGIVDDVQASRWLAVLVALLERPEWLRE
jgi:pyruvate/2-oxoglutarate dehydrogenase complex dihydrolipoamide acyltransferase (E2) component